MTRTISFGPDTEGQHGEKIYPEHNNWTSNAVTLPLVYTAGLYLQYKELSISFVNEKVFLIF